MTRHSNCAPRAGRFGIAAATLLLAAGISAQEPAPDHGARPRRPGFGPGAPGPGGPKAPGGPPILRLARALELSAEQIEQAKALHEKQRESLGPLMEKAGASHEALQAALDADNADAATVGRAALALKAARADVEAARKTAFEQMKSILTPEQVARLNEMEERRDDRDRGGPHSLGPGFGRGAALGPGRRGPRRTGRSAPKTTGQ